MQFKKIGVVGAGTMGADLALDLASYGYEVILRDIDAFKLKTASASIVSGYKGLRMIKKEWKEPSSGNILDQIRFTTGYDGFEEAELVIENIPENFDLKREVYKELQEVCNASVYYGANTSCISITKIAAIMPDPKKVIGMHFMNPVPLKKVVETIRGHFTSDETVETIHKFLKTLQKTGIVVNDFPGFVTNRLSHLFMNEAAFLVQDHVADPKDIDRLFKLGYGHEMGPLETADLIGLDTVVDSLKILYESYEDSKFRCCPLLKKMVEAGLLGRKSGKGFYNYN